MGTGESCTSRNADEATSPLFYHYSAAVKSTTP
jgi:hypothetical protein